MSAPLLAQQQHVLSPVFSTPIRSYSDSQWFSLWARYMNLFVFAARLRHILCIGWLGHAKPSHPWLSPPPVKVTLDEFIDGIMRCKGPARAIDQVAMHAELKQLDATWIVQWDVGLSLSLL